MSTDTFTKQLNESEKDVERFCEVHDVQLVSKRMTAPGSTYIFSDGLGYYTIKGIRASLEE
jgi:hypothetical protein